MQQSILASVLMVLLIALPAQAKHVTHISSPPPAKTKIAVLPAASQASPLVRSTSSSKIVRTFLPPAAKSLAKASVRAPKSTTAPIAQAKPAIPAVQPAADPSVALNGDQPTITSPLPKGALARITAYWTDEDYYTSQHMSSTGVRLHEGHCAVDPSLIPYGSVVKIPGMGSYRAVDTGSAVVSREAAVGAAHNSTERNALVVDLFFENRQEAEQFAAHGPTFVAVSWNKPVTASDAPLNPRALPAGALPQETARVQVYVLESAPSLAECRLPLNFRQPVVF